MAYSTSLVFEFPVFSMSQLPKAALYFTISMGVKPSSALPPIVPRIPEIDFINANLIDFSGAKLIKKNSSFGIIPKKELFLIPSERVIEAFSKGMSILISHGNKLSRGISLHL